MVQQVVLDAVVFWGFVYTLGELAELQCLIQLDYVSLQNGSVIFHNRRFFSEENKWYVANELGPEQ